MPQKKVKKLVWVVFYDNPMGRIYEVMGFSSSYLTLRLFEKILWPLRVRHNPVQSLSHVQLFATPRTACRVSLFINSQSLLKLMSIESVMLSKHFILCHPLFLLPSIFLSIRVFSNESVLQIRWPKYWSFSFRISPSNEYLGLIFFRMDWLDLSNQRRLKSLLQHHSSKASILWHPAFFIVPLSHPYRTIGKTKAFTRWTFVGKVMSLLFNMLSRLVIAFLPRSKRLLISWLQSPSVVILEHRKIKSLTISIVSTSICHGVKRPWCWERLKVGGEGDDRGWDGWMASLTQCTWALVNSGSWWWIGRPGVLQSMGLQRVRHDWVTELNWWDQMPWS